MLRRRGKSENKKSEGEAENKAVKEKTKQMKLLAVWSGAKPETPASGRTASPARIRKAEEKSPDENAEKHKSKTSSPKGNDRSPESNVPKSNLISKNSNSSKL